MQNKTCSICDTMPYTQERKARGRTAQKEVLRAALEKLICESCVSHFITGMARGAETDAAELVLALKETYPHLTLETALPYEAQAAEWSESDRDRYFSVIEQCDAERILSRHPDADAADKHRNYILRECDVLLALGQEGDEGMQKLLSEAREEGIPTVILPL